MTTMDAETIRCRNDLALYESLLTHADIRRVNRRIADREEEGPMGIRRHLLSTSVRLSRRMSPSLHEMADQCVEKLGIEIPVELFVYSSPQFNAACFKPENERLYVMFSSHLIESFSRSELLFVMGHELGHHLYKHHDIPIGHILRGNSKPSPDLALKLFAWSRYAEISADRAGAHCAQDLESVASALFRLASGLTSDVIGFNLEDFLSQVDDMQVEDAQPGQGAPREDWFSTHPFSPLRVKALKLYHESVLAQSDGISVDELEEAVLKLMGLMEPSYIEGRTPDAEAMRRLLFAGAVTVAQADGKITDEETKVFEEFFGAGSLNDKLDLDKLADELPGRIDLAREKVSMSRRMQVVRDLCLIARAEGHGGEPELRALNEIADGLEVTRKFVQDTLQAGLEPD